MRVPKKEVRMSNVTLIKNETLYLKWFIKPCLPEISVFFSWSNLTSDVKKFSKNNPKKS